jgi:hypothetical protein
MNHARIHEIIALTTLPLRKGAEVTERQVGDLHVTEVFAMPREGDVDGFLAKVDVHFFTVGVSQKAPEYRDELASLLAEWPDNRLTDGPSYIESGGELGSQEAALCLYGLGEALGFWNVVTPGKLRITGEQADQMAGAGFVMCSGFSPTNLRPYSVMWGEGSLRRYATFADALVCWQNVKLPRSFRNEDKATDDDSFGGLTEAERGAIGL